ncbi:MAG: T9SS type A sorting domain-containing protein [Lewinellaceae bacterium]|nr:T9SS type A sorting domain-containing protein [Saprospiraceae bacterium]MCB9334098.1 T9SS type A sorting domain-containing protein [Lewinellaceae bacterium]
MRKGWVLALFLASILSSQAQLPAGSVAPNFITTDINGQSWNLYNLLDQGKIVVLEVSATWCSPCWAYHNGHAMHNFYAQHGPEGDDKARVLFIEGDPATNVNCLYGSAGCNNYTPGNWVAGTPFPIINDAKIADTFDVHYYPTIFVICPNRKAYEIGQWNAADIWEKAQTCPVASGQNNAGIFDYSTGTELNEVCGNLELNPAFSLINLGSQALTQATVALKWQNTTVQTIEWAGSLGLYGEAAIAFDKFPVADSGTLETKLLSVNNQPYDDDQANNEHVDNFKRAKEFNSLKILLKIRTDQYGAETYWELRDEQGVVLESGGNQDVGPNGGGQFTGVSAGPGAYGNNTFIRDTLDLPGPGCYSIHFVDAYGDGICCNFGNGYYKLYNLDDLSEPILWGGKFKAYDDRGFSATATTTTATYFNATAPALQVFPNPASDQLHVRISLPEANHITTLVANSMGQVLFTSSAEQMPGGEHQRNLDISQLPEGLYWLRLTIGQETLVKKFLVQRK